MNELVVNECDPEYVRLRAERKKVLEDYQILGTRPNATEVDYEKQRIWFLANVGFPDGVEEGSFAATGERKSLCQENSRRTHLGLTDGLLLVPDIHADPVFYDHPEMNALGARFYVRGLSQKQQDCLRLLSKQVVAQMELRISNASLKSALAARDVFQAKNAESEAALHALKSSFVACVSHEVRTPLNAISGAATLLASAPMSEEQAELVRFIRHGASQMGHIIKDILEYGRLQNGAFPLSYGLLRVQEDLIVQAWRMVRLSPLGREMGDSITMTSRIAPELPSVIVGDKTRLAQVVCNILFNALKFTPAGGSIELNMKPATEQEVAACQAAVSTRTEALRKAAETAEAAGEAAAQQPALEASSAPADSSSLGEWACGLDGDAATANLGPAHRAMIRIEIADSGVGLAPDKLALIFAPFFSERHVGGNDINGAASEGGEGAQEEQESAVRGGTGLGLAICRDLVQAMGGDVWAESGGAGKGTVFIVILPAWVPASTLPVGPVRSDWSSADLAFTLSKRSSNSSGGSRAWDPSCRPMGTAEGPEDSLEEAAAGLSIADGPGAPLVIVADDDRLSQTVTKRMLEACGARVVAVSDGVAALEAYTSAAKQPALVVLDLQMPRMGGAEVARRILALDASRGREPATIAALTGSDAPEDVQRSLAAGFNMHISKPLGSKALKELRECLSRRANRDRQCGAAGPSAGAAALASPGKPVVGFH